MIKISVGNNWVITSDSTQFILNRKKVILSGVKQGQEYLEAAAYYSNISLLIEGLIRFHVRESTVKTISGLSREVESIGKLCQEAFSINTAGGKQ